MNIFSEKSGWEEDDRHLSFLKKCLLNGSFRLSQQLPDYMWSEGQDKLAEMCAIEVKWSPVANNLSKAYLLRLILEF